MRELRIALFANKRDVRPEHREISWPDLAKKLQHFRASNEKDGPLWCPAEFKEQEPRADENVVQTHLLVFDFDGQDLDTVLAKFDGYELCYHTTFSGVDCFRVVLPLKEPVSRMGWRALYVAALRFFQLEGLADETCKNESRFYYLPSAPAGAEAYADRWEGVWLDPAILPVPVASPPSANTPPPTATPTDFSFTCEIGRRDAAVHQAASKLAFSRPELSLEQQFALLLPSLDRIPLGGDDYEQTREHWYRLAKDKLERARADKAAKDLLETEVTRTLLDWRNLLDRRLERGGAQGQTLLSHDANAKAFLELHPSLGEHIRWNLLTSTIEVRGGLLLGCNVNDLGTELACAMQSGLETGFKLKAMSAQTAGAALLAHARRRPFDPLKEHLDALPEWDKQPRLVNFFHEYVKPAFGQNEDYLSLAGLKWFIGTVARALRPGCKMDNCLILEGDYGIKKSGLFKVLAGPPEFYSETKLNLHNKDSLQLAGRFWIVEIPELAGYTKSDREALKAFMSTQTDTYRPPYGRATEVFPRRCVFVGTTNSVEYLTEPNRREWPVAVQGQIDLGRIAAVRDQLWAEALHRFKQGEEWWMTYEQEQVVRSISSERGLDDGTVDMILDWYSKLPKDQRPHIVTARRILVEAMGFTKNQIGTGPIERVCTTLRSLGCHKIMLRPGLSKKIRRFDIRPLKQLLGELDNGDSQGREDSEAVGQPGGELLDEDDVGLP